jgi:alpha-tubulin suppressor-like RCC1 family protein
MARLLQRLCAALPLLLAAAHGAAALQAAKVATGDLHSCALTTNGGVECWGSNEGGRLGSGSTAVYSSSPVPVAGLASGVAAIDAGGSHTCALTTGGAVLCWGVNSTGQLGDFTTTNRDVPVPVFGLSSGVLAISLGQIHSCALLASGTSRVRCWGANTNGQVGDGSTVSPRLAPSPVPGLGTDVAAIAAGVFHTCFLKTTGQVSCLGGNTAGQLGNGTTTSPILTAVSVSGMASGVTAIAAGIFHTCAIQNSAVWCWGTNVVGQLGIPPLMPAESSVPLPVTGLTGGISAISARSSHTCALDSGGGVLCWGFNLNGQLGTGATGSSSAAVGVSGLASGVDAIDAGGVHSCAVTEDGGVVCWGSNARGQLGIGTASHLDAPVEVEALAGDVAALGAGESHTCALTPGGGVECWGENTSGQLGNGTNTPSLAPVAVSGLGSGVAAVAVGGNHGCALTTGGGVSCWGANPNGQLGDGTTTPSSVPVPVTGLAGGVAAIAAAKGNHSCALTTGGGVLCWGRNHAGQLGNGTNTTGPTSAPVAVSGLASGVAAIALGTDHSCALTLAGGVVCWGLGLDGQLGNGGNSGSNVPVPVTGLSSGVLAIAAAGRSSCALTASGVACWGHNAFGQLGDGTTTNRNTPVAVIGLPVDVTSIAAGSSHVCALTSAGALFCWGGNDLGQLGDDSATNRSTAVPIAGLPPLASIALGAAHSCALAQDGDVFCWGDNASGQLGLALGVPTFVPTPVLGFGPPPPVVPAAPLPWLALAAGALLGAARRSRR